jgi:hypothetical protein
MLRADQSARTNSFAMHGPFMAGNMAPRLGR